MILDLDTFLNDKTTVLPPLSDTTKYLRKTVERRITPELNIIHVGVGEVGYGLTSKDVLRITALGSCVGLILTSKVKPLGYDGHPTFLAHVMLPTQTRTHSQLHVNENENTAVRTHSNMRNNEGMFIQKIMGLDQEAVENYTSSLSFNNNALTIGSTRHEAQKTANKRKNVGKYANVAIQHGLNWFKKMGINMTDLEAHVIGGARMFPNQQGGITSNIGALNALYTLKLLSKYHVKVKQVFAGGITRKAIVIFMNSGEIYVRDGDDHFYYRIR